jgi:hypothetical protein
MKKVTALAAAFAVTLALSILGGGAVAGAASGDNAAPPWGPETPNFNLQVILRPVGDGSGFGLVKFRQPNDADKIVYLDTWVRDLAPDHNYNLQRAVDNPDGNCTSSTWLTLGRGTTMPPQPITTDDSGTGSAALYRNLAAFQAGTMFDIHFRVIDADTLAPVLESACYQFTVSF